MLRTISFILTKFYSEILVVNWLIFFKYFEKYSFRRNRDFTENLGFT